MAGFEDGTMYKIISAADSTLLDVKGGKIKKDSDVISYWDNDAPHQKFVATKRGTGFSLNPKEEGKKSSTMALDYNIQKGQLGLWDQHNNPNQLFMAQETAPCSGVYLIKSLHNNYCLRANGTGNYVTFVPENSSDMMQHWKLASTYY